MVHNYTDINHFGLGSIDFYFNFANIWFCPILLQFLKPLEQLSLDLRICIVQ